MGVLVRSDFVWLREALSARYVGVLLPCLPEKKFIGSNSPEFIQTRMRALGIFLTRLCDNVCVAHPPLPQFRRGSRSMRRVRTLWTAS